MLRNKIILPKKHNNILITQNEKLFRKNLLRRRDFAIFRANFGCFLLTYFVYFSAL